MSKYDLARMEHYTQVCAGFIKRGERIGYASERAKEAVEFFEMTFPRPESDDD